MTKRIIEVDWETCQEGRWCELEQLNFDSVPVDFGVYVIWRPGVPQSGIIPRAVYVGQGDVAARLSSHRNDPGIMRHQLGAPLLVTCASVPDAYIDGVERFLADSLHPLEGDNWPDVPWVPVNLPSSFF